MEILRHLQRDPTTSHKKRLFNFLQQLLKANAIEKPQYFHLYPGEATPRIYGLSKNHKEGTPLRLIVSSMNSITENIAKLLTTLLATLVGNTSHRVNNPQDLVSKVWKLKLNPNETMVSYDVRMNFPGIPTTEALMVVKKTAAIRQHIK